MPKSRIMIQLEPETIEQVDKIRGAVPRAAWVRLLIEDRLDLVDKQMDSNWEAIVYRGEASVSQQEENRSPKPGDERSNRSRRAGKGRASGTSAASRVAGQGNDVDQVTAQPVGPSRSTKKGKACTHTNQIRKLGAAFCTDCGEFV